MKIIAVNGSPRTACNTSTLLHKALEGATAQGAEVKMYNLYDIDFKGCISCFACKRIDGPSYGKCAYRDDLSVLLDDIATCDGLIIGSPIYFGQVTGEVRSFMERLLFQYIKYSKDRGVTNTCRFPTAMLYTMNVPEDIMKNIGYPEALGVMENSLKRVFGSCEAFYSNDTYQFDDYSLYVSDAFDPQDKARHRDTQFPVDCQRAYDLGVRMTQND